MTDPLRSDRSAAGDSPDRRRDARIEELLLAGLDHYFSGEHELAINVWTRVLFLDRGHARARAYIERARGAVAERQREADELFHSGADAMQRGDRTAARRLLTSAVERGAAGEDALALLHRLDRLETAGANLTPRPARQQAETHATAPGPARRRDPRVTWGVAGVAMGILMAAVVGGYLWIVAEPMDLGTPPQAARVLPPDPLPVPSACELRLARANALYAQGRLHDALTLLEAGDPDERHQASFDLLRAAVQRQLLAAARNGAPLPAPGHTPR